MVTPSAQPLTEGLAKMAGADGQVRNLLFETVPDGLFPPGHMRAMPARSPRGCTHLVNEEGERVKRVKRTSEGQ